MLNRKQLSRLLSLMLCLMISSGIFLGCNKSTSFDQNGTPNGTKTSGTASPATEAKKAPVTLYYFRTTSIPPADWELKAAHDYILESTGYDMQWITAAQGTENDKLNIIFASKDNLDLVGRDVLDYKAKGLIQAIDEPLKKYGQNIMNSSTIPKELWEILSDKDGKIYGIPQHVPMVGTPLMFRADWMKKLGLSIPNTLEEYENVLKVIKEKDPAGGGQTVPVIGSLSDLNIALSAGFTGAGIDTIAGGSYIKGDNGNFGNVVMNPGYKEFISKLADWYKKGYFNKENFGMNVTNMRELIAKDVVATTAAWVSTVTLSAKWWESVAAKNPEADYVWNRNGIKGAKGLCETMPGYSTGGYVVPLWSKKAEDVVKYMNWVYASPDNFAMTGSMKVGTDIKWLDKEKGIVQLINGKQTTDYAKPFIISSNILEKGINVTGTDGKIQPHNRKCYVEGMFFQYDRGVKNTAWQYIFDSAVITKDNPSANDINTAVSENLLKFIMGVRPMSEYDTFTAELKKMGVENLDSYITKMYKDNNK